MPRFDYHDLEIVQRITAIETILEIVKTDVADHRTESEKRSDELKELIEKLGDQLASDKFKWSSIFSVDAAKLVAYVILSLSGVTAAASALLQ